MTQAEKVINLCSDWEWHCQQDFRNIHVYSPHKRRIEIEGRENQLQRADGKYIFIERKCEHNIGGQKDYRMTLNPDYKAPPAPISELIQAPSLI